MEPTPAAERSNARRAFRLGRRLIRAHVAIGFECPLAHKLVRPLVFLAPFEAKAIRNRFETALRRGDRGAISTHCASVINSALPGRRTLPFDSQQNHNSSFAQFK
jgi:hypothetical protein